MIVKSIPGYEGLYSADIEGDIWNDKTWTILAQDKNKYGYNYVKLRDRNGKAKNCRVHRLVATTFLENPYGYTDVNHKNENKRDNRVCNLEWCSRKQNCEHGTARMRLSEHRKDSPKVKRLAVVREFPYKFYNSMSEAQEVDGYNSTHIRECCNGKRKTHGGATWRYATSREIKRYGRKYTFIKKRERG